jgi:hypothetical protein
MATHHCPKCELRFDPTCWGGCSRPSVTRTRTRTVCRPSEDRVTRRR